MNEPDFKKIQCGAGHWCPPVSVNDMLPRTCPECGMPYDRRRNKAVLCFADGSVPEEEKPEDTPIATQENTPEPEPVAAAPEEPDMPPPGMLRRRRPIHTMEPDVPPEPPQRSEPQPFRQRDGFQRYSGAPDSSDLILRSGQFTIPVPESGVYLGREETGGNIFGADMMVSRRHCFVKATRFGEVQVTDSDSLNGTFIDDGSGRRRLGSGETVSLRPGGKMYLADFIFVIEKKG